MSEQSASLCSHIGIIEDVPILDCCGPCSQWGDCVYIDPSHLTCDNPWEYQLPEPYGTYCDQAREGLPEFDGRLNSGHYIQNDNWVCSWARTEINCGVLRFWNVQVFGSEDAWNLRVRCVYRGPFTPITYRWEGVKYDTAGPFGTYTRVRPFPNVPPTETSIDVIECNLAP